MMMHGLANTKGENIFKMDAVCTSACHSPFLVNKEYKQKAKNN
jgi:hypothetical protein